MKVIVLRESGWNSRQMQEMLCKYINSGGRENGENAKAHGVTKAEAAATITHADKGGGQILVCVAGHGYYQEEGKEAQELHPGDVVNIPAGVKHWYGAEGLLQGFYHAFLAVFK